jgi:hypothetical protein
LNNDSTQNPEDRGELLILAADRSQDKALYLDNPIDANKAHQIENGINQPKEFHSASA